MESSICANKGQDYKIKYVMGEEKGNKILSDVSLTHLLKSTLFSPNHIFPSDIRKEPSEHYRHCFKLWVIAITPLLPWLIQIMVWNNLTGLVYMYCLLCTWTKLIIYIENYAVKLIIYDQCSNWLQNIKYFWVCNCEEGLLYLPLHSPCEQQHMSGLNYAIMGNNPAHSISQWQLLSGKWHFCSCFIVVIIVSWNSWLCLLYYSGKNNIQ